MVACTTQHWCPQVEMVKHGAIGAAVMLGETLNEEVQQDVARCLANLACNEDNHVMAACVHCVVHTNMN